MLHSFSKLSAASPVSQLNLQPFRHFTYITAHSPTLPLLHLHHSSFSNPSFASLMPQVFTYVTWRAAHAAEERHCDLAEIFIFVLFHLYIHGLEHKSWQLFYFVDICERITNVYVSCGMSAGIVSTHVVNTLSFCLYMSHFPTGLVSSKKK